MKKFYRYIFIILTVGFLGAGCATQLPRAEGYGQNPLPVATPLPQPSDNGLGEKMDTLIYYQKQILQTMQGSKPAAIAAAETPWETPPPPAQKNVPCKKTKVSGKNGVSRAKLQALQADLARMNEALMLHGIKLEEMREPGGNYYHIYRIGFAAGSADIKKKTDKGVTPAKQIKDAVLAIETSKETIIQIVGYTDDDGSTKNSELDKTRALETANQVAYHRPKWINGVKPEGGGATNQFGIKSGSRCALIICEKTKTAAATP